MQHDIYSLGVCLLEIGLWEPFVVYDGEDGQLPQQASIQPRLANASTVKDTLTSLASNDLPKKMGDKYSQVVVNCLGCLDEDNTDFGDGSEFKDEDGVLIAVKYIEKVLSYNFPIPCHRPGLPPLTPIRSFCSLNRYRSRKSSCAYSETGYIY